MVVSKNSALRVLLILLVASFATFLQGSAEPQESIFSRGWRSLSEMGSKIWQSPYSYTTAPLALYAAYKIGASNYFPDKKTLGLLAIPTAAAAYYYGPTNVYTTLMNKIRGQTTPMGEEADDNAKLEEFETDLQSLRKRVGDPFVNYKFILQQKYSLGGFSAALDYFEKVQNALQLRIAQIKDIMAKNAEILLSRDKGLNEEAKRHIIFTLNEEVVSRVNKGSSYSSELDKMESTLNAIIESSKQELHQPIDRHQDATKLEEFQKELLNLGKMLGGDSYENDDVSNLNNAYKKNGLKGAEGYFNEARKVLEDHIAVAKKGIIAVLEQVFTSSGLYSYENKQDEIDQFMQEVEHRVKSGYSSYKQEKEYAGKNFISILEKIQEKKKRLRQKQDQQRFTQKDMSQPSMVTKIIREDTGSGNQSFNKQSSDLRRSQYDEGYETLPKDILKEIEAVVDLKRIIEGSGNSAQIDAYKTNLISKYAQKIRDDAAKESIKQELGELKEKLNREIRILELEIKIANYKYQVLNLLSRGSADGRKTKAEIAQAKNSIQTARNNWFQSMIAKRNAADFKGLEPIKQEQIEAKTREFAPLEKKLGRGPAMALTYDWYEWDLEKELNELKKQQNN